MFRKAVLLPKSTLMLADTDLGFPGSSVGKESACNAGDPGSISELGRSPGESNCYPLQYSGLENSMDCIVHEAAKTWVSVHFLLAPWGRNFLLTDTEPKA